MSSQRMNVIAVASVFTAAMVAAAPPRPQTATTPPQPGVQAVAPQAATEDSSVGVAAAADSSRRFQLWLLSRSKTRATVAPKGSVPLASDIAIDAPALLKELNMPDWQAHIIWSWGDQGPCESAVQREIQALDLKYNKSMYSTCIWPGGLVGRAGRACVMQNYACDAARHKFDEMALDLTISTQKHNGGAEGALRSAGAWSVAEFLRSNRGCR